MNLTNNRPSVPVLKNPGENAWADTLTPVLATAPATDPDNDTLTYRFEIYADEFLTDLVAQGISSTPQYTIPTDLIDKTRYYWQAFSEDEHGLSSDPSDSADFFVQTDGANEPPLITFTQPPADLITNSLTLDLEWTDEDTDSPATIAFYYDMDAT
ncbi:MAG: hypothetical protein GY868_05955, partial [Deltaproteobacteria bacterium]|nr:hypothetical protein [Deltaproteobacteria bacterium]